MDRRLEAGLVNATVVAASLAVTYLVVQFVFFRFLLADLPPNLRPYLPDRARVFAQTSAHEVRRPVLVDGQIFPVSQVYAHSQRICEGIRRASLANGAGFVRTPRVRRCMARATGGT